MVIKKFKLEIDLVIFENYLKKYGYKHFEDTILWAMSNIDGLKLKKIKLTEE